MYRKIFIIFIAVFVSAFGAITQALFVFLLVIGFLIINMKLKPFSQVALNDLESMSLVASMITVYCGIFFMEDKPEVYNSSSSIVRVHDNGLRLNQEMKIVMFLLILVANLTFFFYWFYKMFVEVRIVLLKKSERFYLYFFLCGSKDKLVTAKAIMEENEINEILREDFYALLKA